ncbi:RidA family protein [Sphingomonas sediminicola]|uniref:RidA family protein n=1 Tax=Sphingomonas sediminicola TaxID=386874 RepID=A0ABX6TAI8_9SPHN|nr:RidA family protein [Sphingomonas sediminicola]QNP46258.1 RidA family protein [Sphingomonas sediminicola]
MTAPPDPVGLYEPFTKFGDLVFLSAISSARDGTMITGKVGAELSLEDGREAARRAAANLLAVLSIAAQDEANIGGILLLRGQVNATDDFTQVHKVIDAASELIVERLGEKGRHARTAIGCATLPNNNAVTLEGIARVAT